MASILDKPAVRNAVLPLTVEQYHRLGEAGIIAQNTELLHGVIFEKTVKSSEHSWLVQRLVDWLRANVKTGLYVRQEQPLTFADSEPEPDIAVVRGVPDDHRRRHPSTAALVIEVALSSEPLDREKASLYAEAGVEEYWLVLPQMRRVEVHTQPYSGVFQQVAHLGDANILSPMMLPSATLEVSTLFDG
jgi:Uma2 family endonuclease